VFTLSNKKMEMGCASQNCGIVAHVVIMYKLGELYSFVYVRINDCSRMDDFKLLTNSMFEKQFNITYVLCPRLMSAERET
jgi:hypothetical protein